MAAASWWAERRYGLFVHANIATVPAFAPVGEYADWYWSHWSPEPLADVILHPRSPLPEVRAFHRAHHPDVTRFDDFIPELGFAAFDAEALATLARDAGMRYLVQVTKHHDGFCWWDAPLTNRSSVRVGPRRDIVAEVAAACRRADLVFGTYHSLLDWGHPAYPAHAGYVDDYLHPQVLDLVERFGSAVLWGDGHWGHDGAHWRSDALIQKARALASRQGVDLMVNDRWWASAPDFRTFEYDTPADVLDEPWELCRGLGHSFCLNRAEGVDDHLTPAGVVALLTEVVAKGGNLLLNVGPAADGTVPEIQSGILRQAGAWVTAHDDAIHDSRPFASWGDATCRFTLSRSGVADRLNAIDTARRPLAVFAPLAPNRYRIGAVRGADGSEVAWEQDRRGLVVSRPPSMASSLAPIYHVAWQPTGERIVVRAERGRALAALVESAIAGSTIELPAGRYRGRATVPAAVTVRGEGRGATVIDLEAGTLALGAGAGLHDLSIVHGPPDLLVLPGPTVVGSDVHIGGCEIEGGIWCEDAGERGPWIRRSVLTRGGIRLLRCSGAVVQECTIDALRWGVGVEVVGGHAEIERCQVSGALCAVRFTDATGSVDANTIRARWWGVHMVRPSGPSQIGGNRITATMRAVDVEGGTGVVTVTANRAERCDSALLAQAGANVVVEHNTADGCRVGAYLWDCPHVELGPNRWLGCRDGEVITGP